MKKILSLAVALAMVIACVPMMAITASAAAGSYVLFDASMLDTSTHGDIALTNYGWSGDQGAVFSSQWSNKGTWNTDPWGAAGLMFWRVGARQDGNDEDKTANISGREISAGAEKIVIDYTFAMQDEDNNYQTWYFKDLDGNTFATVYYDQGVKATAGAGGSSAATYADGKDAVYALRGTSMQIVAAKNGGSWTVTYTSNGKNVGTETVASINGIGSISANLGQWNNQYAAMAMQGLKITVDIDVDANGPAIWENLQKQTASMEGMKIRGNIDLPDFTGLTWESEDPAAIDPVTGAVNRPAYGEAPKNVRLTMVWNGNRKDVNVTLLPTDAGDSLLASVDFDKEPYGASLSGDYVTEPSMECFGNAVKPGAGGMLINSVALSGLDSFTISYDSKTSDTDGIILADAGARFTVTDTGSVVTAAAPEGSVSAAGVGTAWKKVVVSYSAGEIRLYVNGALVSAPGGYNVAGVLSGISSLALAGTGYVDNIYVFNRALTAQDIDEYMAGYVTPVMNVSGGSENYLVDTYEPITIGHYASNYIYYTLDGTDPTPQSTKYTGPFFANGTAHVKARTIASNGTMTGIVEAWVYNQPWNATAAEYRIEGENTVNNVKIGWPMYPGAASYAVYRDNVLIGTAIGDCLDEYDLPINKNISYTVFALDSDGATIATGTTNTVMTFAIDVNDSNGYDDNVNGGWKPNEDPNRVVEPSPSGYHIGDKYYSVGLDGINKETFMSLGFTSDEDLANFDKACSVMAIRYKESDDGFNWPNDWTYAYPIFVDIRMEGKQNGLKYDGETISFSAHAEGNGFACSKLFFATFQPGKGDHQVDPFYVIPATGQIINHMDQLEQYELYDNAGTNQLSGWYVGRPFGHDSRDMVRFVDGHDLYTFSATNNNQDMMIMKLQDNWVVPAEITNIILKGQHQESPSVFHDGNAYYVYTSTTNGWFQSQARYSSSPALDQAWSPLREVANTSTFGTQANGVWGYGSDSGRVVQRGHGYNWGQSGGWRRNNYQRFFHLAINNGIATGAWCYRMEYDPYWGAIAVQSGEYVSLGKKATINGREAPELTDNLQMQASPVAEVDNLPFDIVVDLETPTVITEVNLTNDIYMGSVCASYYKAYGSNDMSNWTMIADVTDNNDDDGGFHVGWVTDTTPYRYVKVTVEDVKNIQNNNQSALWGGKPQEVAIYGKPVGHVDENVPFDSEILVGYDRKNIDFTPYGQAPVIVNDRTLVPLRAIFEAMGADVQWDDATSTATAVRGDITVSISIGSNQLYVNGAAKELDVPAQLINNRTMVPVRAIAEGFGCEVNWSDKYQRVYIEEAED